MALFWLTPFSALTQPATPMTLAQPSGEYRADRILAMPRAHVRRTDLAGFQAAAGVDILHTFEGIGGLQVVKVSEGESVTTLIAKCERSGLFAYAEPDYVRRVSLSPNDPKYLDGTLWGLHNTGQNGGVPDADIDAPEGWDVLYSASNIIVAVLDTGVRFTHEDLAANMWVNPDDGGHGLNAFTGTNNVMDDQGHGTLMSGVLGAVGHNGKGVTGVAWQVQIMAGKCFDSGGNSSDSLIIACIDYARTNGARILNASFDSPGYSQSLSNAIYTARDAGIILVASCGNNALDVDREPRYPACYQIDNVVSVTATTRADTLWNLANYGATNVHLAAPGEQIHTPWSPTDSFYTSLFSGTSLAAPFVTGAFALMLQKFPNESHQEIIARVLNAADPLPALHGKCVTGGRLNLRQALSPPVTLTVIPTADGKPFQLRVAGGPNRTCVIEVATDLSNWAPVFTNTTLADGTFDFTEAASTHSPRRFYRAVSGL